jgi:hypothetical protein
MRGYHAWVEAEVKIEEVKTFDTSGGNVRFVVRDSDGNEYTTFRERIGEAAQRAEGRRARIEYHENKRGQYTNVYLDKIEPLPDEPAGRREDDTDPDEAAWRTAVEAAPWLVGESEPHEAVEPGELYEKLRPFKDKVAEDIKEGGDDEPPSVQ